MSSKSEQSRLPLSGVTVVDLTSAVVGPYATQVLADFGAQVIKVEEKSGDVIRWICGRSPTPGMSGKYLHLNRNKRSISLDLKQPEGREVLLRLVDRADVFLHNMRTQAIDRLGLGSETLSARNPRLVYGAILGFGSGGRYAGRPAYDSILQGGTGLAHLFTAGGREPRYVPYVVVDRTAGLMVANAVFAALFGRERNGRGRIFEIPMFESFASLLLSEHMYGHTFDPPTGPLGDQRLLDANAKPVATKDGYVCITTNTDAQVAKLFTALDRPDLASDTRFATSLARIENVAEFFETRAQLLAGFETEVALAALLKHDVPAMRCHTLESLLADSHVGDVGLIEEIEHPTQGRIKHINVPLKMTDFEPGLRHHAPHVGENTEAILAELGYAAEQVHELLLKGAAYRDPNSRTSLKE